MSHASSPRIELPNEPPSASQIKRHKLPINEPVSNERQTPWLPYIHFRFLY